MQPIRCTVVWLQLWVLPRGGGGQEMVRRRHVSATSKRPRTREACVWRHSSSPACMCREVPYKLLAFDADTPVAFEAWLLSRFGVWVLGSGK